MALYDNEELKEIKRQLSKLRTEYKKFMLDYKIATNELSVRLREILDTDKKRARDNPEKPGRKTT